MSKMHLANETLSLKHPLADIDVSAFSTLLVLQTCPLNFFSCAPNVFPTSTQTHIHAVFTVVLLYRFCFILEVDFVSSSRQMGLLLTHFQSVCLQLSVEAMIVQETRTDNTSLGPAICRKGCPWFPHLESGWSRPVCGQVQPIYLAGLRGVRPRKSRAKKERDEK